jgi:hypothetical protein
MLQWLHAYVASVCFQCFICFFRCTLQMCLSGCCMCFTYMLQVLLYLNVVYVCNIFKCFLQVFQTYVANVLFFTCVVCVLSRCRCKSCSCCEQKREADAGGGSPAEAGEGGPHGAARASRQQDVRPALAVPNFFFEWPEFSISLDVIRTYWVKKTLYLFVAKKRRRR